MKYGKKWLEINKQPRETLTPLFDTLVHDVSDVLDMSSPSIAVRNGGQLSLVTVLSKESLVRKFAAWLRKKGGHAELGVRQYHNRPTLVYRYDTLAYSPLPPSTRFDTEGACWNCGRPTAPWWSCSLADCNAYLCRDCVHKVDNSRCPAHTPVSNYKDPEYKNTGHHKFTIGLEVETERRLSPDTRSLMCTSPLIAGWGYDCSLPDNALEYQTQPITPAELPELVKLISRLPKCTLGKAGGHMHVSRTPKQTCGRWYHALAGLHVAQARGLNMRHADGSRWCQLTHGEYWGKHTAINGEHRTTIELRTFGHWDRSTAPQLSAAVQWVHAMWRLFESVPVGRLKAETIRRYASNTAKQLLDDAPASLGKRLADYKANQAKKRALAYREMRARIIRNVEQSQEARRSHGTDIDARLWRNRQEVKQYRRDRIATRFDDSSFCFVWPNGKHITAEVVRHALKWETAPLQVVDRVSNRRVDVPQREVADRVAANILKSRKARLSHGVQPTYANPNQLLRILAKKAGVKVTSAREYGVRVYRLASA